MQRLTTLIAVAVLGVVDPTDRGHVGHHRPQHVVTGLQPSKRAVEVSIDVRLVGHHHDEHRMAVMGCDVIQLAIDVTGSLLVTGVRVEPVQHALDVVLAPARRDKL